MSYRKSLAVALVATTILGGAAYATEQATTPATTHESAAQRAVDQDVGKLSKDGAQAFRDMHLARIAIFDADPAQAKSLIAKAQAALTNRYLSLGNMGGWISWRHQQHVLQN